MAVPKPLQSEADDGDACFTSPGSTESFFNYRGSWDVLGLGRTDWLSTEALKVTFHRPGNTPAEHSLRLWEEQ